ncbi:glycerol-3-phosphate dehydrogenase [Paracraurococcus ruber]|uniref:Glycerol-3-phosphate dehydrogenase n=1 Tax=Paracraurococcus ruber TaxID=77675 RepID=A0ABS1CUE4_9PROT|nr:glycerol-3-phosphate dehydrogenase [Paracraurococcus ruber]MBK1657920.1 glycerol-3-phosphate dehydrogenase [Paracraurococcus ruber]TDG33112.1 glycerol-3-phosphate dehydrogenase [Paracraurococcus ruber]
MSSSSTDQVRDLLVIGGGVNGCGIARDAAGRGLSVTLAEKGDLAGATSSASTKLIHGGLRYLEHYEFRLVREALVEREVLLQAAPHIVWPLRFVLPHHKGLRPWPLLRLGLFLYDHLGGRRILPPTRGLDLRHDPVGEPLRPAFTRGFEYSDCWVEDARLVVLNARDAADRGAEVLVRTRVASARRDGGLWRVTLREEPGGTVREVAARVLVNAAGPWAAEVLGGVAGLNTPAKVRLVKGSHLVTRRLYGHDRCYIFQNADGRICFAIPYEEDFTLIGTTDEEFHGDPGEAAISDAETDYLLEAVSGYFRQPVTRDDVIWSYAGVRPLYDDGASRAQEATRDYVLTLDAAHGEAPLLSIFGGKITTYRRLAEAALAKLGPHLPGMGAPWTARAHLPGGDFPWDGAARVAEDLRARYPFLEARTARRLVRQYGTRAPAMLGDARSAADLGQEFGAGLTAREVDWQIREEWARAPADILWRRSKLGLRIGAEGQAALAAHMDAMPARRAAE